MKIYCTKKESGAWLDFLNYLIEQTENKVYSPRLRMLRNEFVFCEVCEEEEEETEYNDPPKKLKPGDICVIQMAFNEQNGIFLGMNGGGTYGTFLIRNLRSDSKTQPLVGLSIYSVPAENLSQKVKVIGFTDMLDGIQHII